MSNKYCQCPHIGEVEAHRFHEYDAVTEWPFVNHEPSKCKCTNDVRLYRRGAETLMLCSICNILGDIPVKE